MYFAFSTTERQATIAWAAWAHNRHVTSHPATQSRQVAHALAPAQALRDTRTELRYVKVRVLENNHGHAHGTPALPPTRTTMVTLNVVVARMSLPFAYTISGVRYPTNICVDTQTQQQQHQPT